jgi:hypothetical protein
MIMPKNEHLRSELFRPDGFVVLLLVISLTFDSRMAQWWFGSLVVTLYIAGRIVKYRPQPVRVHMAPPRH